MTSVVAFGRWQKQDPPETTTAATATTATAEDDTPSDGRPPHSVFSLSRAPGKNPPTGRKKRTADRGQLAPGGSGLVTSRPRRRRIFPADWSRGSRGHGCIGTRHGAQEATSAVVNSARAGSDASPGDGDGSVSSASTGTHTMSQFGFRASPNTQVLPTTTTSGRPPADAPRRRRPRTLSPSNCKKSFCPPPSNYEIKINSTTHTYRTIRVETLLLTVQTILNKITY